jgi:hypothetical protein
VFFGDLVATTLFFVMWQSHHLHGDERGRERGNAADRDLTVEESVMLIT